MLPQPFAMIKTSTLTLLIILFIAKSSFSQNSTLRIAGKITSKNSGEPLSYATITFSRDAISTISNDRGEFVLNIPASGKSKSITISHVGYESKSVSLTQADTGMIIIKLTESAIQMEPVTVQPINALELVKKAIARIPENYPSKPFLSKGFYRLAGRKEERIIQMSEAVLETHRGNYLRSSKQVKLIKSRYDKDLSGFNGNDNFDFGSNSKDILDYDIVSNVNESDILGKDEIRYYQFTYRGIINYQGTTAHKINFDQKDGIKKSLKQGTILIDTESLAFLEFKYRKNPKGLRYWTFGFTTNMLMKLNRLSIKLLQDSSTITYQSYGGKYYLQSMIGITDWSIEGGKGRFEINPFRLKNDYLVTSIDTIMTEPFQQKEVMSRTKFMEFSADAESKPGVDLFWKGYNHILPNFNVDSVLRQIRANNRKLNLKDSVQNILSKAKKDKLARIDTIMSIYHRMNQFNGTVLIGYDNKILFEKGFGLANREKNIPNNINTQFRIGSTSKQFTCMLIMQLAAEGRLSVKDSVGKFIPAFIHSGITLEQLMTHQSGIPNYTNNPEYLAKIIEKKYHLDELVTNFCSDPLEFAPGTAFRYSNSGYLVLALIIEKLTGKTYGDVLKEKIFVPLEMTSSFFVPTSPSNYLAIGYVNDQPELSYAVENIAGAGAITSTCRDLLKWNEALTNNKLLPKDEMSEIFTRRVEWKEWAADYGYGWMLDRSQFEVARKHEIQYHPGTEPGFYSMFIRQPDKGIVIILLNNSGEFPRFDMSELLLNELN